MDALMNNELLSPGSLYEMQTFVPASFNSWTAGYGLGLHHAAGPSDDTILGHDGYYSNLTDMFHSRKHGFTLVTMTNTQTSWFGLFNPLYAAISDYIQTTSVKDVESILSLDIYPNPSQNKIHVSSNRAVDEVLVVDVFGKIIHNSKPDAKDFYLSINIDGLYFVIIGSGSEISRQKLIVEN